MKMRGYCMHHEDTIEQFKFFDKCLKLLGPGKPCPHLANKPPHNNENKFKGSRGELRKR